MSALGLVAVASLMLGQADGGESAKDQATKLLAPEAAPENPGPDVEHLPFTRVTVQQVIDFNLPRIQACYNELLAGMGPKAPKQGVLNTSWKITPQGMVSGAKVEKKGTTIKDPKLNDCVVAVLTTMSFPKPTKEQPIEFPFNLKATR